MSTIRPMLAHLGSTDDLDRDGFIWSPKLDGVRCLAFFDGVTVRLVNRREVDITNRYPDVVLRLATQLNGPCVLDGELVAFDAEGKISFTLIAQRDQASRTSTITAGAVRIPVSFMAFDVLSVDGEDLRSKRLSDRLDALDALTTRWHGTRLQVVLHTANGRALWDTVVAQQLEGVVGKDANSRYVGTRSRDWLKIKTLHRISCVATGYEAGMGSRASTLGALVLQMFTPDGRLVQVGRVGTGFKQRDLVQCKALLDAGQPFVAEIECLSLGTGRMLRHPSFKGIRSDLGVLDCGIAQLDTLPST